NLNCGSFEAVLAHEGPRGTTYLINFSQSVMECESRFDNQIENSCWFLIDV
ncbi:unnamed protein product, partial [Rotaria sordida]